MEHICSNQEAFSSTIRECCEKPLVEKCQCVVEAEFDDKPADLPPIAEKYIQDPDVCKHVEEGHNKFMGEYVIQTLHILTSSLLCLYTGS